MQVFKEVLKMKTSTKVVVGLFFGLVVVLAFTPRMIEQTKAESCAIYQQPVFNPFPVTWGSTAGTGCTDFAVVSVKDKTSGDDYAPSVNAQPGDTLYVDIYVHNGAAQGLDPNQTTMKNINVSSSIDTGSGSNHTVNVTLSADNTASKSGSATITTADGATLQIVPSSGEIFDYQGNVLQSGLTVGNNTLNIGDQQACFDFSRQIRFEVKVVGQTVNPTPTPTPTPTGSISGSKLSCSANGYATYTLHVASTNSWKIYLGSVNGKLFASGGPTAGTDNITGPWVTDNMTFYLVDANTGSVLGTYNSGYINCANPTPTPTPTPTGSISGSKLSCSANGYATYTLHVASTNSWKIYLGSVNGKLFASGGPTAGTDNITGPWVTDNMTFYLVDANTGSVLGTYNSGYINCANPTPVTYTATATATASATASATCSDGSHASASATASATATATSSESQQDAYNKAYNQAQSQAYASAYANAQAKVECTNTSPTPTPTPAQTYTASATANATAYASVSCADGSSASASATASATATATSSESQQDAYNKAYNQAQSQAYAQAYASAQAKAVCVNPTPTPTYSQFTCSPTNQNANVNQQVWFSANGGNGDYYWSAPGSSNTAGNGNSFSTSYQNSGNYNVTFNSNGQTATCYVSVNQQYTPVSGNSNLVLSKKAWNDTQNVDATSQYASKNDYITYTLTAQNTGNAAANNFVVSDDLSKVLPYASVTDLGGGSMNGNVISWYPVTVPAGGSVSESFKIQVTNTLSDNLSYTMTNTYGNMVTVVINTPTITGVFVAPKTGANTMGVMFAGVLTAGFATYKKRSTLLKLILN